VLLKHQFKGCCLACGKNEAELKLLGRKLVPDHIIPLAKGGLNTITNLQPLCHGKGGCNLHKGTRVQDFRETFLTRFGGKRHADKTKLLRLYRMP